MRKKINRRQFLLAGLGTTIATAVGQKQLQMRKEKTEQAILETLAREQFDPEEALQTVYQSDLESVGELAAVQQQVALRSPTLPYNRAWSKQLITASKLATQQYQRGKFQADYDGRISQLPIYTEGFAEFDQMTSFKALEPVQEDLSVTLSANHLAELENAERFYPERQLERVKQILENRVQQVVKLSQRVTVYYGFLLTSPDVNLLVFRGTQRTTEFIEDVLALQQDYTNPLDESQVIGKVHVGFYSFYQEKLAQEVRAAVQQLSPTTPLLISGHSLGAALATFAAMDIALSLPKFKPQIHLYTYAGPRVGSPDFIKAHSELVPNHYRVVNLADMVPMLPLTKLFGNFDFVHGGEQWSFLSQQGDILPNHIVETYRTAIEQEAEVKAVKPEANFSNIQLELNQP